MLTVISCPPGHVLRSVGDSNEYECRCNLENDQNILSCLKNESKVTLKVCAYMCTYI